MRILVPGYFLFFLAGCAKPGIEDHIRKFSRTPFLQSESQECLEVSALFVTPELKALQDLAGNGEADPQDDQVIKALRSIRKPKALEFRLRLSPEDRCRDHVNFHNSDVVYGLAAKEGNLEKAIGSFSANLAAKIWLKVGEKRIKPSFLHVESSFGLENSREVWLLFPTDDAFWSSIGAIEEVTLVTENPVSDKGLFILAWPGKIFRS